MVLAGAGAGAALVVMTAAWAMAVRRADTSVVDRAWGLSCVAIAAGCALAAPTVPARGWLAAGLVAAWGVRLSAYLWWRDRGQDVDWRHARLRERWGRSAWWRSLPALFWAQGLAAAGVATPLYAAFGAGGGTRPGLGWLDAVGVAVWAAGFGFEAAADAQLARFRRAQSGMPGRVLRHGLWRWTRHPNYFGDAVQWWGVGLVGLAAGPWWALVGPAVMTVVLLRVTGVAVMDAHLRETRGDEYADYVASTSAFLPRPPR